MNLIIKMTNACNFNCNYCSVGNISSNSNLNVEYVKKFIDGTKELLDYKQDKTLNVLWHGGEPLLISIDVYRELQDYIKNSLKGIDVKFSLQTNGSLINNQWIEFFKEYNISPGISLDGYKELHDVNRLDKLGNKTFDKVVENIEFLMKNGITPGILMVLNTAEAIDINKLYEFLAELKCPAKIHAVFPAGRAEDRTDLDDLFMKYVDTLIELFKLGINDDRIVNIEPLNSLFTSIVEDIPALECSHSGKCGIDFMCLHEDGAVSFCGRNDASREFMYGNIVDSNPLQLYLSEFAKQIRNRDEFIKSSDCGKCKYFNLCHGGCPFEAFLNSGKIEEKYKHCNEWQRLLDFLYTDGLDLFRKKLVERKKELRAQIREKEIVLEEYT